MQRTWMRVRFFDRACDMQKLPDARMLARARGKLSECMAGGHGAGRRYVLPLTHKL